MALDDVTNTIYERMVTIHIAEAANIINTQILSVNEMKELGFDASEVYRSARGYVEYL